MASGLAAEKALRNKIGKWACEGLCGALNSLTGSDFEATLPVSEAEPETPQIWRQGFSLGAGEAWFWLLAGKDLRDAAGEMIMGGGGEAVPEEDCRSTWNEIAGQTMSGLGQALTQALGREVPAVGGAEVEEGPGDQAQDCTVEVRQGGRTWLVRIAWNPAFGEAVAAGPIAEPALSGAAGDSEPVAAPFQGGLDALTSKTLDLLMDVALPVSVSFGKTTLQIREVLKLNTGSVVELNRLVTEPVEVIVNNCVIARGEVVTVDGNYGVRIIHLASRADRLRSGMDEASARLGLSK